MKIAFFTENGYAGGLDTFTTNLINHWPRPDDELVLICNASHPGLETVARNLVRPCLVVRHRIPLLWVIFRHLSWLPAIVRKPLSPILKYLFFFSYFPQIAWLLSRIRPDRLMVINGGYPGGDSCRAASIIWGTFFDRSGTVHNFHNLSFAPRWWERWPEAVIDDLIERSTRRFVSPSRACSETLRLRPALMQSRKIGFIHNGTDAPPPRDPAAPSLRARLNIAPDAPMISMLGTYEPRKGHAFLIEAFAQILKVVPAARLVITGYGSDAEVQHVRDLAAQHGITDAVRLEGFWINKHVLMDETTLVVVSSQGFESFGLTLIEAMSHGVPVVTTRVGGTSEVVDDDTAGYSVDPSDLNGFVTHIVDLLTDEALRQEKGRGGYRRFQERFTIDRMVADYAKLICGEPK